MTSRSDTINLIARMVATHERKKFNELPAAERIALNVLANDIMAAVERRMARQSPTLDRDLKTDWILPA